MARTHHHEDHRNLKRRMARWLLAFALGLTATVGFAQAPTDADLSAQALDLYRKGDCDRAVPAFQQLLQRQPKDVASRKLLAKCLLQQSKWDEARAEFESLLRDSPQDLDAVEGVNAALKQLQKREQIAQSQVVQSRAASAEQLRSKHELDKAMELVRLGRSREAEEKLKQIIAEHPDWMTPRQRLAEFYSSANRFTEAAEIYRWLAAKSPAASALYLQRTAQNFDWGEKYSDAAKYYRLYLKQRPADFLTRMALARILVHDEQFADAVTELKTVLERRPDHLPAQLALAQCYERLEQPQLALQAYDRVLQLDPNHRVALQSRERYRQYFDELPLKRGFAALDKGDWSAGVESFKQYLQAHPDHQETVLRIARTYSAHQQFGGAREYYLRYLQRAPADLEIRRELARVEMWAQDYSAARKLWEQLVAAPGATPADYEGLIQSCVWGGDLQAAEPAARKLATLRPGDALAARTLQDIADHRRFEARQQLERLIVGRRFREAVDANRQLMATYGANPESQLLTCRLHSWGRDLGQASTCYHEYLINNPTDDVARLELADVDNWAGRFAEAELQYRKVLKGDPQKAPALLGLAQSLDARNEDPINVQNAFRSVLQVDPENSLARQKVEQIHSYVAPRLDISHGSFSDTDGLYWAVQSVSLTFTFPGRVKFSPYYTSGYFRQGRTLQGTTPEIVALNQTIAGEDGIVLANGGGVRMEFTLNPHWSLSGDAGALHFDGGRTSANGRAELNYRPSSRQSFGITYIRREAIFDIWTLATLASGMVGDTVLLSTQQSLGDKWRASVQGGFTAYSAGTDLRFHSNTQRRLWAQLDYPVRKWLRLGYVHRLSSFVSASPIYFSPSLYQTHGLSYAIDHAVNDRLRLTTFGDFSYSRSDATDAFEMAVLPAISYKLGGGFFLDLGYRFTLGQTSAFGIPSYRTQGGEVRLRKVF